MDAATAAAIVDNLAVFVDSVAMASLHLNTAVGIAAKLALGWTFSHCRHAHATAATWRVSLLPNHTAHADDHQHLGRS